MFLKKPILFYILPILTLAALFSCEKDDICSSETETTPRLLIEFYDTDNPENIKSVPHIRVQGVGNDNTLEGLSGTSSANSIALPLRTDALITEYVITKDYDESTGGNPDILRITYNREDIYVSRACGYKTIFTDVIITIVNDGDNWIDYYQPVDADFQNVENERETHFYLFH